jgi:hypothetical protein
VDYRYASARMARLDDGRMRLDGSSHHAASRPHGSGGSPMAEAGWPGFADGAAQPLSRHRRWQAPQPAAPVPPLSPSRILRAAGAVAANAVLLWHTVDIWHTFDGWLFLLGWTVSVAAVWMDACLVTSALVRRGVIQPEERGRRQ